MLDSKHPEENLPPNQQPETIKPLLAVGLAKAEAAELKRKLAATGSAVHLLQAEEVEEALGTLEVFHPELVLIGAGVAGSAGDRLLERLPATPAIRLHPGRGSGTGEPEPRQITHLTADGGFRYLDRVLDCMHAAQATISPAEWKRLLDQPDLLVIFLDHEGRIRHLNAGCRARCRNVLPGDPFDALLAHGRQGVSLLRDLIGAGIPFSLLELDLKAGEEVFPCYLRGQPTDSGWLLLGHERRTERSEELRQRRIADLERTNRELELFVSSVAHDLKSPLITVRGFAGQALQQVRSGKLESLERRLESVTGAAEQMEQLISGLLTLARAGQQVREPSAVSLHALVNEAIQSLEFRVRESGATIVVQDGLPVLLADPLRMRQVFQNLLANALEGVAETEEGRISITARTRERHLLLKVEDNGRGIAPEDLETILRPFQRGAAGKGDGSGLGLALVKRIVEAHLGRFWLESEGEGRGCAACFTLPDELLVATSHEEEE